MPPSSHSLGGGRSREHSAGLLQGSAAGLSPRYLLSSVRVTWPSSSLFPHSRTPAFLKKPLKLPVLSSCHRFCLWGTQIGTDFAAAEGTPMRTYITCWLTRAAADFLGRTGDVKREEGPLMLRGQAEEEEWSS